MIRTLTITSAMNLQSLRNAVLSPQLRPEQADAAVARLQQLNPHADLDKLQPGTVIFLPDTPAVSATSATSVLAGPIGDFHAQVTEALNDAARDAKTAVSARAAERADVTAALGSAAFKAAAANDPALAQLADAAAKLMAAEDHDDKLAADALSAANRAALQSLAALEKLLG